jgi:hypothetical protein
VRLCFAYSLQEFDDVLQAQHFDLYEVLAIVALGDKQFDVAVSEAAQDRLTSTCSGFYTVIHTDRQASSTSSSVAY